MAKITFKTYVADNATPQFIFASQADTPGTSSNDTFTAPSGWNATTISSGEVVITKTAAETSSGGKTYEFDGIGWDGTEIAFPRQTVTRLTDTDQFMNPYLEYTPSIEIHVNNLTGKDCLIFKFENDYVGLRSTETIKLIRGKEYTLASNTVGLDCYLLSGNILKAGQLLGTYDFTFTGGSGTFEVVNFNKLSEDGDLDWSADFAKKTMLSSKHKIDSSSYDNYNSNPIYNKRSYGIEFDTNFKFHGVGDFAGYTKLKNLQGPSNYMFEAIDLKYVFAGYNPTYNKMLRTADFSAVTSMEGFLSGATNYADAINFPTTSNSITNMSYMLEYVNKLTGKSTGISAWNTENVTSMEGLLEGSISGRYIGSWNVSKVTNFKAFLKNNRKWNASVRGFYAMQGKGLGVGVTSSITMESFFENSIYNKEIGRWKLDKVHNVNKMFKNSAYTGKTWNFGLIGEHNLVATVTADSMWEGTIWNPDTLGNAGAGNWFKYPDETDGTGKVTSIKNIFKDSKFGPLNGDNSHYINSWNTENVTDMEGAFQNSLFNGQLRKWDVGKVLTMKSMFEDAKFNQHIRNWQPTKVATLENFAKNADFNREIASWNLSLAGTLKNADGAFSGANSAFNQNIAGWNGVLTGANAGEGHHTIFDGNSVIEGYNKPAVVKTAEADFQEDPGDTGGDGGSSVYVTPPFLKSNFSGGLTTPSDVEVQVQLYAGFAEVTFKNLQIDFSKLPDWYRAGSDAGTLGGLSLNVYLTKPDYTDSVCWFDGKCNTEPSPQQQDTYIWAGGTDGKLSFDESNWLANSRSGSVFETRTNTSGSWTKADFFEAAEEYENGNEALQKSPHSNAGNAWATYLGVYLLNNNNANQTLASWTALGTGTGILAIRVTLSSNNLQNPNQYSEYVIPASQVNITENT